jgi:hypothetical protein
MRMAGDHATESPPAQRQNVPARLRRAAGPRVHIVGGVTGIAETDDSTPLPRWPLPQQ